LSDAACDAGVDAADAGRGMRAGRLRPAPLRRPRPRRVRGGRGGSGGGPGGVFGSEKEAFSEPPILRRPSLGPTDSGASWGVLCRRARSCRRRSCWRGRRRRGCTPRLEPAWPRRLHGAGAVMTGAAGGAAAGGPHCARRVAVAALPLPTSGRRRRRTQRRRRCGRRFPSPLPRAAAFGAGAAIDSRRRAGYPCSRTGAACRAPRMTRRADKRRSRQHRNRRPRQPQHCASEGVRGGSALAIVARRR